MTAMTAMTAMTQQRIWLWPWFVLGAVASASMAVAEELPFAEEAAIRAAVDRVAASVVRIETAVAGGLTREDFVFSPSVSWAARKHGRLVTLQGSAAATSTPATNPQRPRPAITISAALPSAPAVPLPVGDAP